MELALDERETRKLTSEMGKRILGVECPTYNKTGDICKECERVRALYRRGTEEDKKDAGDKRAKPSYFLSILQRDGTTTVLKLGKKVANKLYAANEKHKARTGNVFGFADPAEGMWVSVSKAGQHPAYEYDFENLGERAESVTKKLIDSLPTLDNLTSDFQEGKLEIFDISSLNPGDSKEFRILPTPTSNGKYIFMMFRYYHWRCTEAEILGGGSIDAVPDTTEIPKDFQEFMTVSEADTAEEVEDKPTQYTSGSDAPCFGHFDGDPDCMESDCDLIREECAAKAGYTQNEEGEYVKKKPKKKK